jgi:sugar lactone lactonase YvrE
MQQVFTFRARKNRRRAAWPALLACLLAPAFAPALRAQVNYYETNVTVATIGGGPPPSDFCASPAGFVNGPTLEYSQFDGPVAMALNSQATLFIADFSNNAVRMVTAVGDTANSVTVTSPMLTNLSKVAGVAVDTADNLYVVTQGDKTLRKYNNSLNLLFSNALPYTPAALAVSMDSAANIFVAFTNGMIVQLAQSGAAIVATSTIVASGSKLRPGGIAWRKDGVLAVSDLSNNAIYLLAGTNNSIPVLYSGGGANGSTPGWVDGALPFAEFNQPSGLAWSPDGQLVVADRLNNAVRRIDAGGIASTIYGVSSGLWTATDCSEAVFSGWMDGAFGAHQTNATGDAPAAVLLASSGTIYVTELRYDLLREVKGLAFASTTNTGTNGVGTNTVVIPPPSFSPGSGYYPECQTIYVTSSVPSVYYTTDGSIPTTNSAMVANMVTVLTNGQTVYEGSLQWCNPLLDLTSLHLIAASGTNLSVATNGVSSHVNQIGFPFPRVAGIGSTAVIPVIVTLQSNTSLASLQFDLEIIPTTASTPPISGVTLLPISTNDYLKLAGPAPANAPVVFQTFPYSPGSNGLGLAVLASSLNSGLNVRNFAVLMLLKMPIPSTAVQGQSYTLNVRFASGLDSSQDEVNLATLPMQTLTISNYQYFAGDSSPATGYEAGEFGDGTLNNGDVNNALLASLGIRVPFTFTDAYNAMDVFPETANEIGDGFITFQDWQHILMRSLGVETNNWVRFWTNGGVLSHRRIAWAPGETVTNGISPQFSLAFNAGAKDAVSQDFAVGAAAPAFSTSPPGQVWLRQAAIHAGTISQLVPGNSYSIPVSINVLPGCTLAGLQFRATLVPNGDAPAPGQIQFSQAPGLPPPYASTNGLSPNDIIYAWSLLQPFNPPLQGSNALGSISFQVPPGAHSGQSYTLQFSGVGGAPDLDTLYQLESVPGTAWVNSAALAPAQISSDEWRTYFFGSLTNTLAQDIADPDGDGMPNWQEYLAGTSPTNALSALQFSAAGPAAGGGPNINLGWLTAPGRTYVLQSSPTAGGNNWTSVNTNLGDGNAFQIVLTNHPGNARFYRIQLQQP